MPQIFRPSVLLAAWLGIAVGCAAPPAPLPPAAACQLLTPDDARELGGDAMQSTWSNPWETEKTPNRLECVYVARGHVSRRLGLALQPFASREQARKLFGETIAHLEPFAGTPPIPISGLGDQAVWAGGRLSRLYLLHDRLQLVITSEAEESETASATARVIAARALERLARPGTLPREAEAPLLERSAARNGSLAGP